LDYGRLTSLEFVLHVHEQLRVLPHVLLRAHVFRRYEVTALEKVSNF